ncbi:MAG TPA: hypothetical protein VFZ49_09665 [Pyrinomonadaceae bacterium]
MKDGEGRRVTTTTDIEAKAVKEGDRTGGRQAGLVTAATNSTRVPLATKDAIAVKE